MGALELQAGWSKLLLHALRKHWRWLKWLLAAGILYSLYGAADWRALWNSLRQLDLVALLLALALFVPQTLLSAWRWCWLRGGLSRLRMGEAISQTLAAAALNLLLPAKGGDFCRGGFRSSASSGVGHGVLATAWEKSMDVAVLLSITALGALGTTRYAIWLVGLLGLLHWMMAEWAARWPRWQHFVRLMWHTALLWALHMLQIACFFWAAGIQITWDAFLARMPLALFAGLIPLTPFGLGTRDTTIVVLFSGYAPTATLAVVGLLTATRYIVPGVVGIPCLLRTISKSRGEQGGYHHRSFEAGVRSHADFLPTFAQCTAVDRGEPSVPII